jgi:hypothetical protein
MAEKEVELVLFGLETENDLRLEYPELAEIDEFKGLKAKEVDLVGCLEIEQVQFTD